MSEPRTLEEIGIDADTAIAMATRGGTEGEAAMDRVADLLSEAFVAGAERMRERAAEVAAGQRGYGDPNANRLSRYVEDEIRSPAPRRRGGDVSDLRTRLEDPAIREAIREARIRLDAEDQRWMMDEIDRLRSLLGGRLCVECGQRTAKPIVWACPCGNVAFGRDGARLLDAEIALARKHDPKIVTLAPSGGGT